MKTGNLIVSTLIYLVFFTVIAFACWITKSAWPLLALALNPNIKIKRSIKNKTKKLLLFSEYRVRQGLWLQQQKKAFTRNQDEFLIWNYLEYLTLCDASIDLMEKLQHIQHIAEGGLINNDSWRIKENWQSEFDNAVAAYNRGVIN